MKPDFDFNALKDPFDEGIDALNLEIVPDFSLFRDYLALLHRWNRSYNLTAVREPEAMLYEHIFTSLAVIPFLKGRQCLDIGSGAGIPGLILAMALPETHWTLVDSNGKKTRFLKQAKIELNPGNVEIVQQRIEQYADHRLFSTIICRAWRSLAGFHAVSHGHVTEDGVILAMKPGKPQDELDEVSKIIESVQYHALTIPGLQAKRGLVEMSAYRH